MLPIRVRVYWGLVRRSVALPELCEEKLSLDNDLKQNYHLNVPVHIVEILGGG